VNGDTIAPVKALAGQFIVCNPNARHSALMVIVREQGGRIVGTLSRAVTVDTLQQLEAMADQGALTRLSRNSASKVSA